MTREGAIKEMERMKVHGWCKTEAIDMAIKALEQEPCEDAVSREDAIDTLDDEITITGKSNAYVVIDYVQRVKRKLENLPSVIPKPRTGKWIRHPEWKADGECGYECDQCGMGSDVDYNFCMRCGAKMEE